MNCGTAHLASPDIRFELLDDLIAALVDHESDQINDHLLRHEAMVAYEVARFDSEPIECDGCRARAYLPFLRLSREAAVDPHALFLCTECRPLSAAEELRLAGIRSDEVHAPSFAGAVVA